MHDGLPELHMMSEINWGSEIRTPKDIIEFGKTILLLDILAEEHVYALALNSKNVIVGVFNISHGTVNSSLVSPREVYIRLLLCGAVHYILVHNHPSGVSNPSTEDDQITERLKCAGTLIGIELLDHVIIGNDYYSYVENKRL